MREKDIDDGKIDGTMMNIKEYFQKKIIPRKLIREIVDTASQKDLEKIIIRRARNDSLLYDEIDLRIHHVKLPNREELADNMKNMLRQLLLLDHESYIKFRERLRDEIILSETW